MNRLYRYMRVVERVYRYREVGMRYTDKGGCGCGIHIEEFGGVYVDIGVRE